MFDCLLKQYEAEVLDPGLYETVKESFKKKNKEKNSELSEGPENSESSEDSDNLKSLKTWEELQFYEKVMVISGLFLLIFILIFLVKNNVKIYIFKYFFWGAY